MNTMKKISIRGCLKIFTIAFGAAVTLMVTAGTALSMHDCCPNAYETKVYLSTPARVVYPDYELVATPAIVYRDRAFLPARSIFEDMGARVSYREGSREVVIHYNGRALAFTIDSDVVSLQGASYMLDVAPFVSHGMAYVPIRMVMAFIGDSVQFRDGDVFIKSS